MWSREKLARKQAELRARLNPGRSVMEETAIIKSPETGTVLIARNEMEMQKSQARLSAWLDNKINTLANERAEFEAELETAKRNKWRTAPYARHIQKTQKQLEYYEKLLGAVRAGYALLPDMEISVFAVRVDEGSYPPANEASIGKGSSYENVPSDKLPAGEGEYKSSVALRKYSYTSQPDEKGNRTTYYINSDYQDIAFPMMAAKVQLMDATGEALALKVFDEIGIAPRWRRPKDPMIVGRIIDPRGGAVCFVVAWFLDMKRL